MLTGLAIERLSKCLEPWQGCLLSGIYSVMTSIFDLIWSIAMLLTEQNSIVFFLLLFLFVESIVFLLTACLLIIAMLKKVKWLLIPWMVMAMFDVTLGVSISLVELSLPNRNQGTPCIISVMALIVTLTVAALMLYCVLIVFGYYRFMSYGTKTLTRIKITPVNEDTLKDTSKLDVISLHSTEAVIK